MESKGSKQINEGSNLRLKNLSTKKDFFFTLSWLINYLIYSLCWIFRSTGHANRYFKVLQFNRKVSI